ncbi:hypothetical protein Bphyt_7265 (plasmid) [Paraburkholderia phytofirmans PsJN]|uniref:Uncharacterized protein n=1 Tax=Paraburkholderia phytofirmans (strain DSM 17436 / LMG 22146 / PsJN) TaxID=398527 RepID=B2TH01_PARPJ|nr:hypothetical protein Bphyt_7265 [Paraburkholderia phytofirmans PsJN]
MRLTGPCLQLRSLLSAGGGQCHCGISEGEQPMTIVLIYMSGFLAVVATLLVAMNKTTACPDR